MLTNAEMDKIDYELKVKIEEVVTKAGINAYGFIRHMWESETKRTTRASTIAGRASKRRVMINTALCDTEHKYRTTMAHEWAHVIVMWFYPGNPAHGDLWRSFAIALGDDGERCHEYDVTQIFPDKYIKYVCPCGIEHELGPRVSKKIRAGADYKCRKCKTRIILTPNPVDIQVNP